VPATLCGQRLLALCLALLPPAIAHAQPSTNVEAVVDEGFRFVREGDLEAASRAFASAVRMAPDHRKAAMALGTVYVKLGRDREALEILEPIVAADPANHVAKNNVAWVLVTAGDPSLRNQQRALRLAREAWALAPKDYHVLSTVAEVEFACGQYEEALRAAEDAVRAARAANADPNQVAGYEQQVEKCRQATEAFLLAE
jgi:tetratricopeptide (TPR) repeat protein